MREVGRRQEAKASGEGKMELGKQARGGQGGVKGKQGDGRCVKSEGEKGSEKEGLEKEIKRNSNRLEGKANGRRWDIVGLVSLKERR